MRLRAAATAFLLLPVLFATLSSGPPLMTAAMPEPPPPSATADSSAPATSPTPTQDLFLAQLPGAASESADIVYLAEPTGLLTISIDTDGSDLPETKDEEPLPVLITLTADGSSRTAFGTIRVQGSSTSGWPKKNWSIKLYADEAHTEELRLQIGDSVPSDQWVAKAEWIDPTQLRNQLAYRLWGDMVSSRTSVPKLEVANSDADHVPGATGYPLTFMTLVEMDGEHYGLSTLTLGHDPANFNIDPTNPAHAYFEFDARGGETPTKAWTKFSPQRLDDHFDNYLPNHGGFTPEQVRGIGSLGRLINGSQANFERRFDSQLDRTNMIDMLLYIEVLNDWDAVAQDIQVVSYDSTKWFLLPWDKDTTFGMFWDGSGLMEDSELTLLIDYDTEQVTQKPWFKTYHAFRPEVEARYAELRRSGVFSVENLSRHASDIYRRIPSEAWEAERERWDPVGRPSVDETDRDQIIGWFGTRLETLDEHFGYQENRPAPKDRD